MLQHTLAPPARTPASAHLPPARGFGAQAPAAPAAAGHDFSRISISAPQAGAAPIQRVLHVGGVPQDVDQLVVGTDAREEQILRSWHGSQHVHDFSDHGKLNAAVASAKGQPQAAPNLFQARNFRFRTETQHRQPTLYFKSGDDSARIRQQHPSGPAVIAQQNKRDFFFDRKRDLKAFHRAAKRARRAGNPFKPWRAKRQGQLNFRGISEMRQGDRHYEVTFGQGNRIDKLHRSQGRVATGRRGYDQARIDRIRRQALGYEP